MGYILVDRSSSLFAGCGRLYSYCVNWKVATTTNYRMGEGRERKKEKYSRTEIESSELQTITPVGVGL